MGMFDQNNSTDTLTAEEALEVFVGEGKKYSTAAELAKAMLHANTHISVLESENADLRSKGNSSAEIQELLKAVRDGKPPVQSPPQDQGKGNQEVDIDKLLEEKLNSRLGAQAKQDNQKRVVAHFQQQFGNKAGDIFTKLATELELDLEQLETLAAEKPNSVIKLADRVLGNGQQQAGGTSLKGDQTLHGAQGGGGMPSTKSELLKKAAAENWPREKKYQALNLEMARAAREGRLDGWNR